MRVLFVFPDLSSNTTHYTGVASYGIATLSAVLRRAGHEVFLYHLTRRPDEERFRETVRTARPDLVAFSVNSHYARRLATWSSWAKEASSAPVAVGGIHPTLAPHEVSSFPAVDFTCVGEGDEALPELCAALESGTDPSRIRNLWVRRNGGVVRNTPREVLHDLDALPDPDLALFDFDNLYPVRRDLFPYMMSRGCKYGCTYCSSHALRKAAEGTGRYWRFLSPERAARQLASLIDRHGPRSRAVHFLDAIFFPDREWLREFAPLYRERVGLPFSCNLRADFVDAEVADILRDMNCQTVRFGVESGDERITAEVLNRGLTLDDLRRSFAELRRRGIRRVSYNLVGLPDETLRDSLKTIRLNAELEPENAIPFIFYPYPGTRLHEECAARGYLTEHEVDHYFIETTLRMPSFRPADILFTQRYFAPLIGLYGAARRWPEPKRLRWYRTLDAVLTHRLLPRGPIVGTLDAYRRLRHRVGESLVERHPRLYLLLGGTDPL